MFVGLRLKHRILLGYLIPLLLVFSLLLLLYSNFKRMEEETRSVKETYELVVTAKELFEEISSMQRLARGYFLTVDDSFLQRYEEAMAKAAMLSDTLSRQVRASDQRERLAAIMADHYKLHAANSRLLSLAKSGHSDAALTEIKTGATLGDVSAILGKVTAFEKREQEIMAERQAREEEGRRFLGTLVLSGTMLALLCAIAIGLWMAALISRSIVEAVNAISTSSTEISATVSEHERTAEQQAAMVTEMSSTMDELGVSFRKTGEQAEGTVVMAERSSGLSRDGGDTVRLAVAAMTGLKDKVGGIAEQTLRLGEQTNQIGDIADLVQDLAGQINMLALNAAVEAARAGEHGKGFAVVASEVRKLADQSKKSGQQSKALIAEVQKATNATIIATEEGAKKVEEVTDLVEKVGVSFADIATAANNSCENSQQVLLNIRQQTEAIQQIVEATNTIKTGARETAAGITQTKSGIQQLDETARGLKAIV